MNFKILPLLFFIFIFRLNAQVGINTTTPNGQLDIFSTEYGVLIPRVELTAINIASPILNPETQNNSLSNSTLVYNSNNTNGNNGVSPGFYYWETNQWIRINSGNIDNIYTTDGSLPENRVISQGVNTLELSGITGRNAFILRRTNNSETTGLAFRNSGSFYDASIYMGDQASSGLIFATGGNASDVNDVTTTMVLNNDNSLTFSDYGSTNHNDNNPAKLLGVDTNGNVVQSDVREDWSITGNSGINENNNFLGTTNSRDLRIRTNNTLRATFQSNGQVSINANNNPESDDLFFVQASGTFSDAITGYTTNGIGVHGEDSDDGIGVLGRSENDRGVLAEHTGTGQGYGIWAQSNGTTGRAIFGINYATTGLNYGVRSFTSSWQGVGVFGTRNNNGGADSGFGGLFQNGLGYTGQLQNVSDKKLKKDISKITSALTKIKSLNPVQYNFKIEEYKGLGLNEDLEYGFLAQELQEVLPNLVNEKVVPYLTDTNFEEGKDPEEKKLNLLMVNYIQIIPILTKAMQEQQETIESQEERIAKLEQQVQQLLNK